MFFHSSKSDHWNRNIHRLEKKSADQCFSILFFSSRRSSRHFHPFPQNVVLSVVKVLNESVYYWATSYGVYTVQTPDNVVPLHVHCFFLDQLLSHEGTSYLQHLENSRNKIFACIIQYNSILNWNFLEKYYKSNRYEKYFTSYFEFYRIKFRIFHQRQIALLRLITTYR